MDVNITQVPSNKSRKRVRNPKSWKRSQEKEKRYLPKKLPALNVASKCKHNDKNLQCKEVRPQDIRKFHESFYKIPSKLYQDGFILKHMKVKSPKRRNISAPRKRSAIKTNTKLYIKTAGHRTLRVCQKVFLDVLNIGVHRLRNIAKTYLESGTLVIDKRGGDRISVKNTPKKISVMKFIENFKCIETHYCRNSTSTRKYLASELNIKKMWRMYISSIENDENLKVKECFFRNIFNKYYNIGFKMPSQDLCSKCLEYDEKIKRSIAGEKSLLMAEKRVHKMKAKCFYQFLKERRSDLLTLSYDCQKNQVLPKVADQAAYYSRQLYIYNFTIVQGTTNNTLSKDNTFIYTWTEDRYAKGANEIASAVYHRLTNTDLTDITTLRLMGDGCGAQNKNSIMISMCAYWLVNHAPESLKSIEMVFPVPGHSFLPADRVFGWIEKEIKNKQEIISPHEYHGIYEHYGNICNLGIDCSVFGWKKAASIIFFTPNQYHFKFAPCKRYFLKRGKDGKVLLRGEVNYRVNQGTYKSITKSGKKASDVNKEIINPNEVQLSALKLKDVDKLLKKHFGATWKEEMGEQLHFYKNIIDKNNVSETEPANTNIDVCNYYPEESGVSI